MPLSAKHGGYCNKRALQDVICAGKEKEAPAGLQWNGNLNVKFTLIFNCLTDKWILPGVVEQYDKDLKNLKPDKQYIWHLRMEGPIKLVVTANPVLAALIHEARFIVCDYTFKRTNGDLNKWEVAIWRGATNECKLN